MTIDQFNILKASLDGLHAKMDLILSKIASISGLSPMGLMTGEGIAVLPTPKEIMDNPGKYEGTSSDPIGDKRMSNQQVIMNYETRPGAFVAGTYGEWFKADPIAFLTFMRTNYGGHSLNLSNLSPKQKKDFGL